MEDTVKLKQIKKAKKLLELAKRGIGGEKVNAQKMLDEFLLKHGIDLSEVDFSVNKRTFTFKSEVDYILLTNVILSINPFCVIVKDKGKVKAELDGEDYKEVKTKYKYFKNLWEAELDLLTLSFYTKNEKFLRPDQFAYDKHSNNGKKENEAFTDSNQKASQKLNKNIEQVIQMTPPSSYVAEQTPKQKMEQLNLLRMQRMLSILLNADYRR